jgi:succinate-semialdehyde dehydrogenase
MTNDQLTAYMTDLVNRARIAQKEFELAHLEEKDQHDVDAVCRAVGMACMAEGARIAAATVAETGMGDVQGKIAKMFGVALMTWNTIKGKKSIGVIDDGASYPGVQIVAKPLGVVGACMPSTNPIATIIHNGMCALKCRNAIIIASHPASAKTSVEFVEMIRATLKSVGAPEDLVQCISQEASSLEATNMMLHLCDFNVGTGGPAMVKAVYSAGKPAYGVGQGNAQSIVDEDAPDMGYICGNIVGNRSMDQGVPCTGEQMIHLPADKEEAFVGTMQACGAFLIEDPAVIENLRQLAFIDGKMNSKIVGRNPNVVGKMLGIEVPESSKLLMVKVTGKSTEDLLCKEMLFPIVRYRVYKDFKEGFDALVANLEMEGAGHSSAIWSNIHENITYATNRVPVGRFHVNQCTAGSGNGMPATVTIGCGSWGGNSMSENLNYNHFMNKTHVTHSLPDYHMPDPADWDIWE